MGQNDFLKRYTKLSHAKEYLTTSKLKMPRPDSWEDRNDSRALETYAERKEASGIYALCLSSAPETFHHWKIFAPQSALDEGVCIEFKRAELLESAKTAVQGESLEQAKGTTFMHREMEYIRIEKLASDSYTEDDLPFVKRLPYSDEKEYRLFVTTSFPPESNLFSLKIPLETVNRVTLSPWTSESFFERQKALIQSIPGCEEMKVCHSSLLENERWQKLTNGLS